MRVLLIEPDAILAATYQRWLEQAGHTVAVAGTAQTAVHAADKDTPDVVVLELQLPRHNGVEFLYEFRSYNEWLHVPVIVHTFVPLGELNQTQILERELGVRRILYKPQTSLQQLEAAIRSLAPIPAHE